MATTFTERTHKQLLKKFHVLLSQAGIDSEAKEAILYSYNVESSKDLTAYELIEICDKLDKNANPAAAELDKWRKRVIASVGGYLSAMHQESNINIIKCIACRAAGVDNFNRIPSERLKSLYNAFKNREKDLIKIDELTADLLLKSGIKVQ